ncbi:hypothetical protein BJX61DRAFT_336507 [Aspergillus egyptiacus]|nr:hypothetical protein BJX61DRAFT_336507 [Aspergillus egyptiacus]
MGKVFKASVYLEITCYSPALYTKFLQYRRILARLTGPPGRKYTCPGLVTLLVSPLTSIVGLHALLKNWNRRQSLAVLSIGIPPAQTSRALASNTLEKPHLVNSSLAVSGVPPGSWFTLRYIYILYFGTLKTRHPIRRSSH